MQSTFLKIIIIAFLSTNYSFISIAQDDISKEISYEVHVNEKPLSITKEILLEANSIADLNRFYKSNWVKEFKSVEISTLHNGGLTTTKSQNDILTEAQKKHLSTADVGSDIQVVIRYIPNNNLKQNDVKLFDFSFIVNPDNNATYPGGEGKLQQYLKKNIIDKISECTFTKYALYSVKFTINQDGHISNAHLFESTKNAEVDNILMEAICNMPQWQAASYSNGLKTKQELVFIAGDTESCNINLLNIRKYRLDAED